MSQYSQQNFEVLSSPQNRLFSLLASGYLLGRYDELRVSSQDSSSETEIVNQDKKQRIMNILDKYNFENTKQTTIFLFEVNNENVYRALEELPEILKTAFKLSDIFIKYRHNIGRISDDQLAIYVKTQNKYEELIGIREKFKNEWWRPRLQEIGKHLVILFISND